MNDVIDEFEKNQNIIISGESERKRLLYESRERKLKMWRLSNKCLFRGCNKPSIPRSHTIQKEGSLRFICQSGHLLTPTFDLKLEKLTLKRIGVNDASTFPGFCNQHELVFCEFETSYDLTESKHFQLQIFRTICRELVIKRSLLPYLQEMLKDYLAFRQKKLFDLVKERLGSLYIKNNKISFKSMSMKNIDWREERINDKIQNIQKDIHDFETNYYDTICNDIESEKDDDLFSQGIRLDMQIPVSLAGRGNFIYNDHGQHKEVNVILIILPFESWTYILASTPKNNQTCLEGYFSEFTKHALTILTMIEGWMIYGSDHWFLKPSVWEQINPATQQEILNGIERTDKNIGYPCEYSIFNELRQQFLSELSREQKENLHFSTKEFILNEEQKLARSYITNAS
jgi:hypothetical protein